VNLKQRFVSGTIFIIGGIVLCILILFGMRGNTNMGTVFFSIAFLFFCIGIGQIVFAYILKNKADKLKKK